MPAVTLFWKLKGEPIASTHSPGRSLLGSPIFTVGRFLASIFSSATSDLSSVPTTLAWNSRRSVSRTITRVALSTTCVLVRM